MPKIWRSFAAVSYTHLLRDLSEEKLVFVISHDIEFIVDICDRVVCLRDGKVFEDFILDSGNVRKLKSLLE